MERIVIISAALAAAPLAGCATQTGTAPVEHSQTAVIAGAAPASVYAQIAQQVNGCWFNPADPVLTKHASRATAPADGQGTGATLVIYERARDGTLGLKAFTIGFSPRGDGTEVTSQNHRLPNALGQKLSADIGYWVQGGAGCDGPPARAGGAVRGSF